MQQTHNMAVHAHILRDQRLVDEAERYRCAALHREKRLAVETARRAVQSPQSFRSRQDARAAAFDHDIKLLRLREPDLSRQKRIERQRRDCRLRGALRTLRFKQEKIAIGFIGPAQDDLSAVALALGQVEHQIETRTRSDRNRAPDRLERIAGLAVDRQDQRLEPLEAHEHEACIGDIGEPQSYARARRENFGDWRRLRVRRYQRAYSSGTADIRRIAEILNELPLLIEAPIVDEQRKIAIDLRR